jgi:hypothetical protein
MCSASRPALFPPSLGASIYGPSLVVMYSCQGGQISQAERDIKQQDHSHCLEISGYDVQRHYHGSQETGPDTAAAVVSADHIRGSRVAFAQNPGPSNTTKKLNIAVQTAHKKYTYNIYIATTLVMEITKLFSSKKQKERNHFKINVVTAHYLLFITGGPTGYRIVGNYLLFDG